MCEFNDGNVKLRLTGRVAAVGARSNLQAVLQLRDSAPRERGGDGGCHAYKLCSRISQRARILGILMCNLHADRGSCYLPPLSRSLSPFGSHSQTVAEKTQPHLVRSKQRSCVTGCMLVICFWLRLRPPAHKIIWCRNPTRPISVCVRDTKRGDELRHRAIHRQIVGAGSWWEDEEWEQIGCAETQGQTQGA